MRNPALRHRLDGTFQVTVKYQCLLLSAQVADTAVKTAINQHRQLSADSAFHRSDHSFGMAKSPSMGVATPERPSVQQNPLDTCAVQVSAVGVC